MLDFQTALIGVSFTVVTLAVVLAGTSVMVCVVTLIKNLPKGIKALRAATESSVYALALCGQSVAEEMWFARLQSIFGKYVLFGMCGIYVSVAKLLANGADNACYARRSAPRVTRTKEGKGHGIVQPSACCAAPASFFNFSVVMKQ